MFIPIFFTLGLLLLYTIAVMPVVYYLFSVRGKRHASKPFLFISLVVFLGTAMGVYYIFGAPFKVFEARHFYDRGLLFSQILEKPDNTEHLLKKLRERLEINAKDTDAWFYLGRALSGLRKYPLAAKAYHNAYLLKGDDITLLAEYAESLMMANQQKMTPEIKRLVGKILKQAPDHPLAMDILGIESFEKKDYQNAIIYWQRALGSLTAGDPRRKIYDLAIVRAKKLGGG